MPKTSTSKKTSKKSLTKKLDKVWADRIKARDKKCLRCLKPENLQAAHIVTRSNRTLRWDLRNGLTLCAGCHLFWAHKEPLEFAEFVKQNTNDYEYLLYRKNQMTKWTVPDMELLLQSLKQTSG